MKRYKSEVKDAVKETKEKIKEASFSVMNVGSAQDAIIGSIDIIGNIKRNPTICGTLIGEAFITGIDEMYSNIEDEAKTDKMKSYIVKKVLRSMLAYKKSLV